MPAEQPRGAAFGGLMGLGGVRSVFGLGAKQPPDNPQTKTEPVFIGLGFLLSGSLGVWE
jgi:hypothetical protein